MIKNANDWVYERKNDVIAPEQESNKIRLQFFCPGASFLSSIPFIFLIYKISK